MCSTVDIVRIIALMNCEGHSDRYMMIARALGPHVIRELGAVWNGVSTSRPSSLKFTDDREEEEGCKNGIETVYLPSECIEDLRVSVERFMEWKSTNEMGSARLEPTERPRLTAYSMHP
jgi:hypothetical protein